MRTHAHTLQTFIHNKRLAIINARRYIFLSSYFCRLQKQRGSGEVTFLTELQLGIIFSLYLLPRFSFFFFFVFLILLYFFYFTLHTGGSSSYEQRGVHCMHTDITVSKAQDTTSFSRFYDDF